MAEFWRRLRQRKLVQWSVAYVAGSFALIQGLDVVAQRFGWPDRIEQLIILALAVGFFVTLVLAWYHGERGAQRVGGTELLIIALLLAIGGGALWGFTRVPANAQVAAVRSPDHAAAAMASGPNSAGQPSGLLAAVTANVPAKSVAVLPFVNESGNKDEQFFSDGLSDDLITALSQFSELKVISRNSAFQFRNSKNTAAEIGKALGVAHLLEGSVQHAGDEVRITATLVNASDGRILWSERYDKPYKDLFALQDAITEAVAVALKAKLLTASGAVVQSDRPPSGNLDAYAAYQRGNFDVAQGTTDKWRAALREYQAAVRLDPQYARAYAAMSRALARIGANSQGGAAQGETYAKAHAAADQALQLEPDLAAGYVARAYLLAYADFDWKGAEADFRRALELAPNDGGVIYQYGQLLSTLGQQKRALDLVQQALRVDPRHAVWYFGLSQIYCALGRVDDARQAVETAIAVQPGAAAYHEQLAIIEILRGDAEAALAAARQESDEGWREIAMALATHIGADPAAADAALKTLIADHASDAAYQIAEVHALRGDPDDMFEWLDRAWVNRDGGISYLLGDPFILRYRDDPRFAAFCKKVGLPTTTDAVAIK